jgi:hypothetical protein
MRTHSWSLLSVLRDSARMDRSSMPAHSLRALRIVPTLAAAVAGVFVLTETVRGAAFDGKRWQRRVRQWSRRRW